MIINNSLAFFKAKLSESYFSRIGILDEILGGRHWLTSGTFKEKVFISFLRSALPDSLKVNSGFVVFPTEKSFTDKPPEEYDRLNSSGYDVSKQLDIIVYDGSVYAPVYEDQDIAIVSPEAVRGIVEVKGTLSHKHLDDSINSLIDFSNKWKRYKEMRSRFWLDSELIIPSLYQFFWGRQLTKGTRKPTLSATAHRKKLAKALRDYFEIESVEDIPVIKQSEVYGEYGVHHIYFCDEGCNDMGYMNTRGQYIVFDEDGHSSLAGDKTLDAILRDVLCTCKLLKNRLLIDPDESNYLNVFPPEGHGESHVFDMSNKKIIPEK